MGREAYPFVGVSNHTKGRSIHALIDMTTLLMIYTEIKLFWKEVVTSQKKDISTSYCKR